MTIAELIEALKKHEPSATVYAVAKEEAYGAFQEYWAKTESVWVDPEGPCKGSVCIGERLE